MRDLKKAATGNLHRLTNRAWRRIVNPRWAKQQEMTARKPRCQLETCNLGGLPPSALLRMKDEERGIQAAIVPAAGGELASLQVRLAAGWTEVLHRALAYDTWPDVECDERAPLLWPAVGRSFTPEQIAEWKTTGSVPAQNRYRASDEVYEIEVHGFARRLPWQLDAYGTSQQSAYVRCSATASPETRKSYPFEFEITVTYKLENGELQIEYGVLAGRNKSPLPFSIGNHLAVRMPITDRGRFDLCTLRSPGSEIQLQNGLCLLSGERVTIDLSTPVSLDNKALLDTVLGGFPAGQVWVELEDPAALRLRISHDDVTREGKSLTADENMRFVFWGDPAVQYFCPEPWVGEPNSLNTGKGCVFLEPGERFLWDVRLTLQALSGQV